MVMKRYPNGADGPFFFQKRIPEPHPEWVETCEILHASGNRIHFPMIQDLASLLWVVNLGCIDLNQWYATCDEVDRPDYLHFDLDPGPDAYVPAGAGIGSRGAILPDGIKDSELIRKPAALAAFTSTFPFAAGPRKSKSGASPRSWREVLRQGFQS